MAQIEYSFEEVALSLGKSKAGKQQNIALITGTATINVFDSGEDMDWEIESITIEGPILHDPNVDIERGHPLFQFINDSIEDQCGDRIWDDARDASQPDPDAAYDRMRDDAMERA